MPAPGSSAIPVLPEDQRTLLAVGMGTIGGLFIGYQMVSHLFMHGVTSEEKRNILMYAAGVAAVWGVVKLFDLGQYRTWIDPLHLVLPEEEEK
jgi:hypothetical protein